MADVLSRVNLEEDGYEGESREILKTYHTIKHRTDLVNIKEIKEHQQTGPKILKYIDRLTNETDKINQYYELYKGILFVRFKVNEYQR